MSRLNRAVLALSLFLAVPAMGAELNGVVMPDVREVQGRQLTLNGIGSRIYSIFRVPVYVAGLYLEQRSSDPAAILKSPATKLVHMQALYSAGRDDIVDAWRTSFRDACRPPCSLPVQQIEAFYGLMTDVRAGDTHTFIFEPDRVDVLMNNRALGSIAGGGFSELLLGTWIGAAPPTPELKQALLGLR